MEWPQLLLIGAIILVTHFVGAITAYGSTLMALPLLMWVLDDLPAAVFALLVIGTVQAIQIFGYTWREVDWAQWRRFLLYTGCSLPVGFAALGYLPQRILLAGLAFVLLASGLSRLRSTRVPDQSTLPDWLLNTLLVLGGVIHGAFASGGATVVVVGQYTLPRKETFRGTLSLMWIVLNTLMIVAVLVRGELGSSVGVLVLLGLPLVLMANWLGERTARRMQQAQFARLVAVLLVLAGITTLARTLRPTTPKPADPQIVLSRPVSKR